MDPFVFLGKVLESFVPIALLFIFYVGLIWAIDKRKEGEKDDQKNN
ncbi:hypothetical protein ACTFQ8_28055 [Bacillus cereus group sp. MYBK40-2]